MFFASLLRPRRGGKSFQLAEIARDNPQAIVVCSTEHMAQEFSRSQHIPQNRVVSLHAIMNGRLRGTFCGPLLFDNFEYILQDLLGGNVHPDTGIIITATGTNL